MHLFISEKETTLEMHRLVLALVGLAVVSALPNTEPVVPTEQQSYVPELPRQSNTESTFAKFLSFVRFC